MKVEIAKTLEEQSEESISSHLRESFGQKTVFSGFSSIVSLTSPASFVHIALPSMSFLLGASFVHEITIPCEIEPSGSIASAVGHDEYESVKTLSLREARELSLETLRIAEKRRLQTFEEEAQFIEGLSEADKSEE